MVDALADASLSCLREQMHVDIGGCLRALFRIADKGSPHCRICLDEAFPAGVGHDIEALPVGEACTLQGMRIEGEAERADQVKAGASKDAGTAYVSGIGRNLGLDEHDIEHDASLLL